MFYQWISTAAIFYLILNRPWYECLVLAAACAPTDPILANSITAGRFADMHIPIPLRQIISAESAANDGIGILFFNIATLMLSNSVSDAIKTWLWTTVAYELLLSILLGLFIGYLSRITLRYSELNNFIDKRSFFSFEIGLALFTSGISSLLHLSSFTAVFVAGVSFAWDGYF